MRALVYSGQFKRDVKAAKKRGKDMQKLKDLMNLLINNQPLDYHYRDHQLTGNWKGFRDAHIEPDWLLIYKIDDQELRFERTGRHTDLFK